MVLIDFTVQEHKGAHVYKFKVSAKREDPLQVIAKKAIRTYLDKQPCALGEDVEAAMGRIRSISCSNSDITEWLDEPEATIDELDSAETPTGSGYVIELTPIHRHELEPPQSKKQKPMADILMGRAVINMSFLKVEIEIRKETSMLQDDLQQQLTASLYSVWQVQDLGYCDGHQKAQLKLNTKKLVDTLCFVQKHWRVLLRAPFPEIPKDTDDDYQSSVLLNKLGGLKRTGTSCLE